LNTDRYLFAVGPGNVVGSFQDWRSGVRTPSEVARTYTAELFQFLAKNDSPTWVISSHVEAKCVVYKEVTIENRPKVRIGAGFGLHYHLTEMMYAFSLLRSVLTFKPTHLVVDSGTTHWFLLWPIHCLGVTVIPKFHNMLASPSKERRGILRRFIGRLDEKFFQRCTKQALVVSEECGQQYLAKTGPDANYLTFFPQYRKSDFDFLSGKQTTTSGLLRIGYVGRAELNKGVVDLVQIALSLLDMGVEDFIFDVCGDGSALPRLRTEIAEQALERHFCYWKPIVSLISLSFQRILRWVKEFARCVSKALWLAFRSWVPWWFRRCIL